MFDIFKTDTEPDRSKEYEEFKAKREHERDVLDSAAKEWILQSGLGPLFYKQMRDYAVQAQGHGWTDQQLLFDVDSFDTRNEMHAEIKEYIEERDRRDDQ